MIDAICVCVCSDNLLKFLITSPPINCHISPHNLVSNWSQIEHITAEFIDQLASAGVDQTVDMNLMTTVETIFQSLACINASFISEGGRITHCSKEYSNVHMPAVIHAFTVIADMENTCLRNCVSHGGHAMPCCLAGTN